MLTYNELLTEVRQRPPTERLALLEELAHSLRTDFTATTNSTPKTSTDLGWPPDYFEQTFGSLRDVDLERQPQGEYEIREQID